MLTGRARALHIVAVVVLLNALAAFVLYAVLHRESGLRLVMAGAWVLVAALSVLIAVLWARVYRAAAVALLVGVLVSGFLAWYALGRVAADECAGRGPTAAPSVAGSYNVFTDGLRCTYRPDPASPEETEVELPPR